MRWKLITGLVIVALVASACGGSAGSVGSDSGGSDPSSSDLAPSGADQAITDNNDGDTDNADQTTTDDDNDTDNADQTTTDGDNGDTYNADQTTTDGDNDDTYNADQTTTDRDNDGIEPDATTSVQVYWLNDTGIVVGGRDVDTASPARDSITALAAGPTDRESFLGFDTAIPSGVEVLGLTISEGLATVDLSSAFESGSFGTSGELAMVAQVVFTLTQFDTVDTVDIRIDGEIRDTILSHGLDATGLTREALLDVVAPAIVVEHPVPDSAVTAPFEVRGFSRTFEANVQWEITEGANGPVIAKGFTTAYQPDVGVHGPFSFTADLPSAAAGDDLMLTVFEISARDGSNTNQYRVPFRVRESSATDWLRVNGLGPWDFGTVGQAVQAGVSARFGEPTETFRASECGAGPLDLIEYDDFTLVLSENGAFHGWFYTSSDPALTTPSGVTTGIDRATLEQIYVGVSIDESTLGQEFFFEVPAGFIGGFLTDDGATVTDLFAGVTCFHR